jgi:hypothetical protein
MDDRRFDNAVRSLARHRSRRGLLGGLLGGGLALVASHLRPPAAAAQSLPGDPCYDYDQCNPVGPPTFVCEWNGYQKACCHYAGGQCFEDSWCCGENTCFGGVCTDVSSAPTHGEPCQPGVDVCVFASGGFACDYVAESEDYRCCAYPGDRCGGYGECCGDNFCGDDGLCRPMAAGSSVGTSDAAGEWCGSTFCGPNEACCNASCGICVPLALGQGYCPADVICGPGPGSTCHVGPDGNNPCYTGLVCCLWSDLLGTCLSPDECFG